MRIRWRCHWMGLVGRFCRCVQPVWLLVFSMGAGSGVYLSGLRYDAHELASRQLEAAWRNSQAMWTTQRNALHAELEHRRDELLTAQAWIDSLERTVALSHAQFVDTQSELHLCERLQEILMAVRKR